MRSSRHSERGQAQTWLVILAGLALLAGAMGPQPGAPAPQAAPAATPVGRPTMAGFAIVTLADCAVAGGTNIGLTGGGNSGGVQAFNGGIFINSSGASCCGLDPGSSSSAVGIRAETPPFQIWNVGSCNYASNYLVFPTPIQTGFNGGTPIGDPLFAVPEPVCLTNGTVSGGVYQPGNWSGGSLHGGAYMPGIYCVTGNITLGGSTPIQGDGVLFYLKTGGIYFTGQAGTMISAPTAANCLGTAGDPSASCNYKGIAVFAAHSNASTIEVRGNGGTAVQGLIYALNGTVVARSGGVNPDDTVTIGQIISSRLFGDGNGPFQVTYDPAYTYRLPTMSNRP